MKVKEIYPGLYLYIFENQFDMCFTFFRLQEFYESPIKELRGKYFTYEQAIEEYAYYDKEDDPEFTYFADWGGFNVPGKVVNKFEKLFKKDYTDKEIALLSAINVKLDPEYDKYYLIATEEGEEVTLRHEIGHGLYYLNKKYRKEMNDLIKELPQRMKNRIKSRLLEEGYCGQVVKDETHAYLATGTLKGMVAWYDYIIHFWLLRKFKLTFKKYYKEINYD